MFLLKKSPVQFQDGGVAACDLELVTFHEDRHGVTVQLALDGKLAVPATIASADFWGHESEDARHKFLARSARTLLDIFGDAREARVLSDREVLARAAC